MNGVRMVSGHGECAWIISQDGSGHMRLQLISQTRPACLDGRQCSGLCDPKAKCAFDYFLLAHNGDNRWDMFPQRSHDYRHRIAL